MGVEPTHRAVERAFTSFATGPYLAPTAGLEPACTLVRSQSSIRLDVGILIGVADEIRTRTVQLERLVFYRLNYSNLI